MSDIYHILLVMAKTFLLRLECTHTDVWTHAFAHSHIQTDEAKQDTPSDIRLAGVQGGRGGGESGERVGET